LNLRNIVKKVGEIDGGGGKTSGSKNRGGGQSGGKT